MYMLAFLTLIVALIGAYAQMYTAQASRMMAQQSGAADAMLAWHATAVGLASNLVTSTTISAAGCLLTDKPSPAPGYPSFVACAKTSVPVVSPVYVTSATTGLAPAVACSGTRAAPCAVFLPNGYSIAPYTFYSVAFQDPATKIDYVLTYVPMPSATSDNYNIGFICLPGDGAGTGSCPSTSTQLPTAFAAFSKQMIKSSNATPFSYGIVVNTSGVITLATSTVTRGAGLSSVTYSLPSANTTNIPAGSIGLISQISPCPSC